MATLRLRAAAVADLRRIHAYSSASHGTAVADASLDDIDRTFGRLRDHPQIGESRAEFGRGMRSLPCREHRIFYTYADGHVSVVRILHKAMDPRRWLP